MAEKALYVLAGYDEQTEQILSGMQKRLYDMGFSGVQTRDIPMHFTLGAYGADQEEALKARMEKIAGIQAAFRVSFNHIGLFRLPRNDVLFVAPEVSREMLGLKDQFMDSRDEFDWSPHTTLLIDRPETVQKAIPAVLDGFSALKGWAEEIHLYEFWPARHILSVRLKRP